jgi:hypothetical protein
MTVLPTIIRACVIGVASMVPENSPLDSVVFRSSLQILLGVVYVIVFYVVAALVRVLTGRSALMDPTSDMDTENHHIDIEDLYEYNADEDIFSLNDGTETSNGIRKTIPLKSIKRLNQRENDENEGSGTNGLIIRVSQDVERRVRKIASTVACVNVLSTKHQHTNVPCVDDHEPAHTRRGSVDGVISDTDDDSTGDPCAGVRLQQKSSATGLMTASPDLANNHTKHSDDIHWALRSDKKQFPIHEATHVHTYNGNVKRVSAVEETTYLQSDRIYTDVYGLGFASFVLHYTMDCSSMQPTLFLLIGLTCLGARDVSCIALSVKDNLLPQTTLFTRSLTVFSFILLVSAQICMIVGIARVPSYHTDARDGSITRIPAPETVLEHFLARVLPILAPLSLYMVSKRTSVAADVAKTLRRAMPTTVLIALWFITCFGAMSEKIRFAVGAMSVNTTVTELSETDVAINMQLPLLILSPFVKIPALLAIVSCCLTRKSMDVVAALCIVFYAKQLHVVRELEMRQMLCIAFVFACVAWFCLTLRYCSPIVRYVAGFFEKAGTKNIIKQQY